MTDARPLDPAALVAHADGLRALARSLLHDAHLAEDVVQDAMAAAIRRPPAAGVPLGPWLVGAVRNLSRMTLRGRRRSAARDRAFFEDKAEAPADEAVARAEIHRRLVDALLALDEPYRTTLILRYLEGREPTEIARATGVPAETVRTRVHRGLALLRERLRGDDDDWKLALVPLVRGGGAPTATTLATGALLMTTKTKLAAAALVLLLLVAGAYVAARDDAPSAPVGGVEAATAAAAAEAQGGGAARRLPRVAGAPSADAAADASAADATPATPVAERAKWALRVTTNVPGARVAFRPQSSGGDEEAPFQTKPADAAGFVGFEAAADRPDDIFEFVARADGWETKRMLAPRPGDVRIEMRRAVAVRGRVLDAAGAPIAAAKVVVADGPPWPVAADNEQWALPPETASDGSFETFVAAAGPAVLHVEHEAFLGRDAPVTAPATGLTLTLERGLSVAGRVAFPNGQPLPDALVEAVDRGRSARTDADGRFVVSGLARESVPLKLVLTDETRTVEAGAAGVDFVVDRPVARVRYLDVQGRPYRNVGMSVRVHKGGADVSSEFYSSGIKDPDDFVLGTPGATLMVSAWASKEIRGGATLDFGEEARLFDVPVVLGAKRPKGALRLVVRGEADPPRFAYVSVDDEAGTPVAGGWSKKRLDLDAAGAVEIPDVPAGRVRVSVAATDHWSGESIASPVVTAHVAAQVEVGRTTEVVATLVVGGRIRATVKGADGVPIAPHGVRLTTSSDGGSPDIFVRTVPGVGWTTDLDASPSLLERAVAPGRYVVRATTKDDEVVEKEVEVRRGETTDVELVTKTKR